MTVISTTPAKSAQHLVSFKSSANLKSLLKKLHSSKEPMTNDNGNPKFREER